MVRSTHGVARRLPTSWRRSDWIPSVVTADFKMKEATRLGAEVKVVGQGASEGGMAALLE